MVSAWHRAPGSSHLQAGGLSVGKKHTAPLSPVFKAPLKGSIFLRQLPNQPVLALSSVVSSALDIELGNVAPAPIYGGRRRKLGPVLSPSRCCGAFLEEIVNSDCVPGNFNCRAM